MNQGQALIIEDSETQARFIGRMFERENWRFTVAKSIEAASYYLKQGPCHFILLDVFLADMKTLPSIPHIRGLSINSALAVMTAGSQAEAIEETLRSARESQADYVLKKPFDGEQLRTILKEVEKDKKLGRRRPHALVVDDCRFVRHLTVGALADNGYRVSEAKSMEEALASPDIAHVDVVVTDIFMPGMGGIEGTRRIKASWPRVKVVAMSAGLEDRMSGPKALLAARVTGADADLAKPFEPETLVKIVDALVA